MKTISKLDNLLPLCSSRELAEVVGALTGDGSLILRNRKVGFGKNRGKSLTSCRIEFTDQDEFVRNWFQHNFRKVFGIECKVTIRDHSNNPQKFGSNKTEIVLELNSSPIVRTLKCCGVPEGAKVVKSFDIPLWISQGDMEMKAGFMRGLFNAEGWISRNTIGLLMGKWEEKLEDNINFLNGIRSLLNDFEIESTLLPRWKTWMRKDGKVIIGSGIFKEKGCL